MPASICTKHIIQMKFDQRVKLLRK